MLSACGFDAEPQGGEGLFVNTSIENTAQIDYIGSKENAADGVQTVCLMMNNYS